MRHRIRRVLFSPDTRRKRSARRVGIRPRIGSPGWDRDRRVSKLSRADGQLLPTGGPTSRPSRQKRMFDVGHTSSGMTSDLKCSSRLRLRSWGLDSVLLAGWNDLDLVAGVSFRVLVGAFLLERLACLLGHVLSRRFVGHGAPSLGARLTPRFDDTPQTCR